MHYIACSLQKESGKSSWLKCTKGYEGGGRRVFKMYNPAMQMIWIGPPMWERRERIEEQQTHHDWGPMATNSFHTRPASNWMLIKLLNDTFRGKGLMRRASRLLVFRVEIRLKLDVCLRHFEACNKWKSTCSDARNWLNDDAFDTICKSKICCGRLHAYLQMENISLKCFFASEMELNCTFC